METKTNPNSVPVKPRNHLLAFVALHHATQFRKYTHEPYLSHLQAVANMADCKAAFGYEIGLCHDLLEDTTCTVDELENALLRFGYDVVETTGIVRKTIELTDVYTPENSPELNRKHRKHLEALRLHKISSDAQTVKYCDIIDNSISIFQYDAGFAKIYIPEMIEVMSGMNKGHRELRKKALAILKNAQKELLS